MRWCFVISCFHCKGLILFSHSQSVSGHVVCSFQKSFRIELTMKACEKAIWELNKLLRIPALPQLLLCIYFSLHNLLRQVHLVLRCEPAWMTRPSFLVDHWSTMKLSLSWTELSQWQHLVCDSFLVPRNHPRKRDAISGLAQGQFYWEKCSLIGDTFTCLVASSAVCFVIFISKY